MDVFRKSTQHESCLSMSLVCAHEISVSLEWYNFIYGLFTKTGQFLALLVCTIYLRLKENYFGEMFCMKVVKD